MGFAHRAVCSWLVVVVFACLTAECVQDTEDRSNGEDNLLKILLKVLEKRNRLREKKGPIQKETASKYGSVEVRKSGSFVHNQGGRNQLRQNDAGSRVLIQNAAKTPSISGDIFIHQRNGFAFDWNLDWSDYKNGFGSLQSENFWLGLEKVYGMTSTRDYKLVIWMEQTDTGVYYDAKYDTFSVGDEASKYKLSVSGYSGYAGNGLEYTGDYNGDGKFGNYVSNGMKFSTKDQDNDLSASSPSCADTYRGGWWYNNCYMVCLTCKEGSNGWWWRLPKRKYKVSASFMVIQLK